MAVSTCTTRATGYVVGASVWNAEHVDNMNWVTGDRPSSKAYRTTGQSIGSGVQAAIGFDLEYWDVGGVHSTVTNNSRFVAPAAGRYRITSCLQPQGGVAANYSSFTEAYVNGSPSGDRVVRFHGSTTDAGDLFVNEYVLASSGYLEITLWHNHSAAISWRGNCLVEWVSR